MEAVYFITLTDPFCWTFSIYVSVILIHIPRSGLNSIPWVVASLVGACKHSIHNSCVATRTLTRFPLLLSSDRLGQNCGKRC